MQGGRAEILISGDRHPVNNFSLTPDGKELVVFMPSQGNVANQHEFDFFSIETGQTTRRIPARPNAARPMITPDGQNIAFYIHERGVDNLWLQPIAGGSPIRLTDFHLVRSTSQAISTYAWSPNGKRLGVARRLSKGDVVLLQDQNK
jgi:Tol biopolymer transport system component